VGRTNESEPFDSSIWTVKNLFSCQVCSFISSGDLPNVQLLEFFNVQICAKFKCLEKITKGPVSLEVPFGAPSQVLCTPLGLVWLESLARFFSALFLAQINTLGSVMWAVWQQSTESGKDEFFVQNS
jgi:hypothetical protein